MARVYKYGIDFGTTNSSISIVEVGANGKKNPILIPVDYNNQPHEVIKSIVGFKNGKSIVGDDGMFELQGTEDNPIRQVKMKLIANEGDGDIPSVSGKKYTDAMTAILKKLKKEADKRLINSAIKPSGVVIGIPCELNNDQEGIKRAYCEALYKAGFYSSLKEARQEVQFLDEPCAVALYYGNYASYQNKRTMIFDFGGGTLDLAIVDIKEQTLDNGRRQKQHQVIAKSSLYGAGEYITEILFKDVFFPAFKNQHCNENAWNAAKIFRKLGCRSTRSDDIYRELTEKAGACWGFIKELENVKVQLSFEDSCYFTYSCKNESGEEIHFEPTLIKRVDFETALRPLINDIRDSIKRLFLETTSRERAKNFTQDTIESVILAGGSSSIPCIRQMLMKMFPGKVVFDESKIGPYYVNMMTCISQGLAVQGYYDDPLGVINNVTAYDYGYFNGYKKKIDVIIPKNTNYSDTNLNKKSKSNFLPKSQYSVEIEQVDKNKSSFYIDIYEGGRKIMKLTFDKSQHSGYYKLFFSIDAGKGILKIDVYDTIKHCWVKDLREDEREFIISH